MYATNIPLTSQPGNQTGIVVVVVGILPAFRLLQEEVEGDLIYSTVFPAILFKEIHVIRWRGLT